MPRLSGRSAKKGLSTGCWHEGRAVLCDIRHRLFYRMATLADVADRALNASRDCRMAGPGAFVPPRRNARGYAGSSSLRSRLDILLLATARHYARQKIFAAAHASDMLWALAVNEMKNASCLTSPLSVPPLASVSPAGYSGGAGSAPATPILGA